MDTYEFNMNGRGKQRVDDEIGKGFHHSELPKIEMITAKQAQALIEALYEDAAVSGVKPLYTPPSMTGPFPFETTSIGGTKTSSHAPETNAADDPFSQQVGGTHYKSMTLQPITYILANDLGFMEGCIVKYVTRYKQKGGVEDLKKVIHYAEMLIAHVESKGG